MSHALRVNEIFRSIQGESTFAGLPCVFIRLTGCHLRCGYCDTEYAFHEGRRMSLDRIVAEVRSAIRNPRSEIIEITGGEPLLQPDVHPLMTRLADLDHTVLLETSGACDIRPCDRRVIRIMDLKTPGSGEADRNLWSNIEHLQPHDQIKFVLTSREDYDWAKQVIAEHDLPGKVNAVLLSAAHEVEPGNELPGSSGLPLGDLAEWTLADALPVRIQTQLHKLIWPPTTRGV
jgi:7-carboxy-7-deazaguanine synthase